MLANLSSDSAAQLLTWSNRIYVIGAVLTLASAAMVLYEKHSKNQGRAVRWGLATEIVVIIAAFICLCGTVGAISFGNVVSHLKDADLAAYEKAADLQIAQAQKDTASANQEAKVAEEKAEAARSKAESTAQDNSHLRIDVANHEIAEAKANSDLAAQNKKLNDFTQGLAQQQKGMAQQMQVTPSLGDVQVNFIAQQLMQFPGQKVAIHTMSDARCQRLAAQFHRAFELAHLNIVEYSTDMGPIYQGVAVGVRAVAGHPALADVLIGAIGRVGIPVRGGLEPSIPEGVVSIYIGPE